MKRTYRILGFPVFSVETDEPAATQPLTAADNGGDTRSERIDVGHVVGFERTEGWDDRR